MYSEKNNSVGAARARKLTGPLPQTKIAASASSPNRMPHKHCFIAAS